MVVWEAIAAYAISAVGYLSLRALILWILSRLSEAGGKNGQLRTSGRPGFGGHLFKRK